MFKFVGDNVDWNDGCIRSDYSYHGELNHMYIYSVLAVKGTRYMMFGLFGDAEIHSQPHSPSYIMPPSHLIVFPW